MCVTIGKYCDRNEISYLFLYVTFICYVDKLQIIGSKECHHVADSAT